MANIRNSKLFATITAVKIIVFIVKVVIFIFIKITIHCHAVIDQLLQAVISEGQMSVFTSQTGLNLLLVFFLRRPQFHLWICVEVYFWRCTTWFLRNHFYFPGIVRLDWTCGNESTTRRLSNTQGSYPKFWGHPKTQTMQTADCRPYRLCGLSIFFLILVFAFTFDLHIFGSGHKFCHYHCLL